MLLGLLILGVGFSRDSVWVQTLGCIVFGVCLILLFCTIAVAESARCPGCGGEMTQGWNDDRKESDGILSCPKCKRRWRTSAKWGLE